MINKLQRSHPPLACTAVFPIGSTSCACWVLTAWPLNVKPRLGSKHKPWSLELCVCACVCKQSGEQQTCSKISWIYKLESYMWKSYALCQNLKANLTRTIIWIQNKTQSYKKIKTNIPTVEKSFSPVGCRRCWVQVRCCLVFTWWSSSLASCGPEEETTGIFDFCLTKTTICVIRHQMLLMLRIQINKGDFLLLVSLYEALKWELWGKRAPCFWTEIVQLNFRNVLF